MIVNVRIKEDKIVGYRTFPINKDEEYVEVDSIPTDILSGGYAVEHHQLVKRDLVKRKTESEEANQRIYEKNALLKAFEKYKSDVFYGIIEETEQTHSEILAWYKDLKKENPKSLIHPPKNILNYLED